MAAKHDLFYFVFIIISHSCQQIGQIVIASALQALFEPATRIPVHEDIATAFCATFPGKSAPGYCFL